MVPDCLKEDILKLCHDNFTGSHLGERKTWIKLSNRFYWKHAYADTKKYVDTCETCAKIKNPLTTRADLQPISDFTNHLIKLQWMFWN